MLDIGCGGGATSLAIARAVAPGGSVTGIDVSPDLARQAEHRAAQAGLDNARFLCADAATVALDGAPATGSARASARCFSPSPSLPSFTCAACSGRAGGLISP